jgi:hypothetical protein
VKSELLVAVACLAALLAAGRGLQSRHADLRLPEGENQPSLGLLAAQGFSLRKVMADKRWFDLLQYTADYGYFQDDCAGLESLAEGGSDFDPTFIDIYSFSGAMLMWKCQKPEAAARLLKKGILFNPTHSNFKLYLAAFAYRQHEELAQETRILEKLALMSDAPPMLRRILVNLYEKIGRRANAIGVCRMIVEISADEGERRWATAKLERLTRAGREK